MRPQNDFSAQGKIVGAYPSPMYPNMLGIIHENGSAADNGYWVGGKILSITCNGPNAMVLTEQNGCRVMETVRLADGACLKTSPL